ncbi:MAG: methylated-DNA--[protein]-cysteine S-methyltransferase [Christensenellales bacterium]|jgi:methylated-DNA-[protein]-cysteine S-methyltransferase
MTGSIYFTTCPSPLGELTLASDGEYITGLWMEGQKHFGAALKPDAQSKPLPVFDLAVAWLERYFAGDNPGSLPPLAPQGSPYQQAVWQALLAIPRGQTASYGDIARQLSAASGKASSPRAVGSAVGCNPISILIPCHRVVGKDGRLTGYAGGIQRKRQLLALEGVLPPAD